MTRRDSAGSRRTPPALDQHSARRSRTIPSSCVPHSGASAPHLASPQHRRRSGGNIGETRIKPCSLILGGSNQTVDNRFCSVEIACVLVHKEPLCPGGEGLRSFYVARKRSPKV